MPVRIGAALNRRASPCARACPEQLIFDSRMRVLLCVSLTVPIIVCVSLHNGVIHRPLQNDGLDIRLCEPRLRARRQRRHEEAVYRHLGLCIRVACNVTHARDAVHFASAARARSGQMPLMHGRMAKRSALGRAALTLTGLRAQNGQNPRKSCDTPHKIDSKRYVNEAKSKVVPK